MSASADSVTDQNDPPKATIAVSVTSIRDAANPTTYRLCSGSAYTIGRSKSSDIRLQSALISQLHVELQVSEDLRVQARVRGTNPVFASIQSGEWEPLEKQQARTLVAGDSLKMVPFFLSLLSEKEKTGRIDDDAGVLAQQWHDTENRIHATLMEKLRDEYDSIFSDEVDDETLVARISTLSDNNLPDMESRIVTYRFTGLLQTWLLQICYTGKAHGINTDLLSPAESASLHQALRNLTEIAHRFDEVEDVEESEVEDAIKGCQFELEPFRKLIVSYGLRKYLWDRVRGLGNLQELIDDPLITEIMVNASSEIFVERNGRIKAILTTLGSEDESRRILERIVAPIGRHIDYSSPLVDARLDTMRVNAVLDNVALGGTSMTIRKFTGRPLTVEDLQARGTLSPAVAAFLSACIRSRENLMVYGGTGTGKTTLLNILSSFIPNTERIVTIEDSAELQLVQPNLVRLEARPANVEGQGRIAIRDLVRNALRMRPDRIIVGECRGAEAFDMLQAMNTGHPGSMTTAHAETPQNLFMRLEAMCLEAFELPIGAIRDQLFSALDVIVEVVRQPSGARVITRISEVTGIDKTSGRVAIQEIFVFRENALDGPQWQTTGYVPSFLDSMIQDGILSLEEFAQC